MKPPHILYVHMAALGDAIMASASLRLLRLANPGAHIVVLARHGAAAYFRTLSSVDDVLTFVDEKHIDRRRPWRILGAGCDLWRVACQLRRVRWQAVLQWRSQLPDTLLTAWCASPNKILCIQRVHRPARFGAEQLQFLYHDTVDLPRGSAHLVEIFAAPVRKLCERGLQSSPRVPLRVEYHTCEADENAAKAFLAEHAPASSARWVMVNISTRTAYNQWYDDRFAGLVDGLHERGYRVVLSGLPEHRERETAIAQASRHAPVCATGRLGMGPVAALLRQCDFVVALNTGIVHVAAGLGVPVVLLNGRDGREITPWGVPLEVVTRNEYYPSRHPDEATWFGLVQRITVEDALAGVDRLTERLAMNPARHP